MDRRRGGARGGPGPSATGCGRRSWSSARSSVDREDGLGAVELCLVGAGPRHAPRLRAVPRQRGAALRGRAARRRALRRARRRPRVASRCSSPAAAGRSDGAPTAWAATGLDGRKVAVEHAGEVDRLAVVASAGGAPALALVAADGPGVEVRAAAVARRDASRCTPSRSPASRPAPWPRVTVAAAMLARLTAVGGAARGRASPSAPPSRMLDDARAYAAERRQFGRTIGSYQALRHLLADMYVRAGQRVVDRALRRRRAGRRPSRGAEQTAAVAKAYVARARARGRARRAAGLRRHRVHPGAPGAPLPAAHRRPRAAVRRRRAPRARARPGARRAGGAPARRPAASRPRSADGRQDRMATTPETGFNDPTAQRLERITTGADPEVVGPAARGASCTTRAGSTATSRSSPAASRT